MFASPAVRKLPELPVHAVAQKGRKKRKRACAWPVPARVTSTRSTLMTKKTARALRRNVERVAMSTRATEHAIADVNNMPNYEGLS